MAAPTLCHTLRGDLISELEGEINVSRMFDHCDENLIGGNSKFQTGSWTRCACCARTAKIEAGLVGISVRGFVIPWRRTCTTMVPDTRSSGDPGRYGALLGPEDSPSRTVDASGVGSASSVGVSALLRENMLVGKPLVFPA